MTATENPAAILMSHSMHIPYLQIAGRALHSLNDRRSAMVTLDQMSKSVASHPDDLAAKGRLFQEIHQFAATAIVFSALAVEAFINHYILSNTSPTQFKKYYDKLEVKQKILFAPKILKGIALDPGTQEFNQLSELIEWRNELVHFKGAVNITPQEVAQKLWPLPDRAEKSINYAIDIIVLVAHEDRDSILTLTGL